MENKIKRPLSVWIAQIILLIFGLFFLFPPFIFLYILIVAGAPPSTGSVFAALVGIGIYLGLAAFCFAAFFGLVRKQKYARWLGVGLLSLIFLIIAVIQIVRPKGPLQYYEYRNAAELFGAITAQVFMGGLFLFLIFRLAFAKRVTEFLS